LKFKKEILSKYYIKGNFFLGRHFVDEMNVKRRRGIWNQKIYQRVHGTTRKIPQEVFETEEKSKLMALTPGGIPTSKGGNLQSLP